MLNESDIIEEQSQLFVLANLQKMEPNGMAQNPAKLHRFSIHLFGQKITTISLIEVIFL